MRRKNIRYSTAILSAFVLFAIPGLTFAKEDHCLKGGYTIAAINGIFTGQSGAEKNLRVLRDRVGDTYQREDIDYQYLLNPSHVLGIGDITDYVSQAYFNETD